MSDVSPIPSMTVERLRAQLFGGPQVPFWGYDPAQLMFGLEIEYFIGTTIGGRLQLASREQYLAVIAHLVAHSGYHDRGLPDQPGRISKDTEQGFIAIKPDFAWHVLEIALPPRRDHAAIGELLAASFREVDVALASVGLERLDLSCLPAIPERMDLVNADRLAGHLELIGKDGGELADVVVFPALIAATHVHVNCSDEHALAQLPALYEREAAIQAEHTRARHFRGRDYPNVRTALYEQVLGPRYLLKTQPEAIPSSLASYVDAYNRSPPVFPNDRFYPVRDMSYIRPTRYGTLEFRSACSYKAVERLLAIVAARQTQIIAAAPTFAEPPRTAGIGKVAWR